MSGIIFGIEQPEMSEVDTGELNEADVKVTDWLSYLYGVSPEGYRPGSPTEVYLVTARNPNTGKEIAFDRCAAHTWIHDKGRNMEVPIIAQSQDPFKYNPPESLGAIIFPSSGLGEEVLEKYMIKRGSYIFQVTRKPLSPGAGTEKMFHRGTYIPSDDTIEIIEGPDLQPVNSMAAQGPYRGAKNVTQRKHHYNKPWEDEDFTPPEGGREIPASFTE